MSRPSNTTQRRAQIVEAMLHVMATSGYAKATISAIASQAGLASGLVHYHFKSKAAILVELVDTLSVRLQQRLQQRLQGQPGTPLQAFTDALLGLGTDQETAAMACWIQIGAEAQRIPEVQPIYEAAVGRLIDHAEGLLGNRDAAIGLVAACEGLAHLAIAAPGTVPAGRAAHIARQLVGAGTR